MGERPLRGEGGGPWAAVGREPLVEGLEDGNILRLRLKPGPGWLAGDLACL